MRLGFALEGLSNLKILGPLIIESSRFGLKPIAIISRGGGGKSYDIITPQILHRHFPQINPQDIFHYDDHPFEELIKRALPKALLTLNPYRKYSPHLPLLEKHSIASFGLDYFANSLYAAAWQGLDSSVRSALEHLTARFVISDFWRDLECEFNADSRHFRKKLIPLGTPVSDVYNYTSGTKARQQLGLPSNQKIVCLFAPNIRHTHLLSFYGLTTRWKIRRILKNIYKFCQAHGYLLVIKNREKQWDTTMYRKFSDYFLTDIPHLVFPYTSALLLKDCELMIHFGSLAVLEAAATHTPSLGIEVEAIDKLHHYMTPHARQVIKDRLFSLYPDSLYNFPLVSQTVPLNASTSSVNRICEQLISARTQANNQFTKFNRLYSGFDQQPSTERILTYIAHHLTATTK